MTPHDYDDAIMAHVDWIGRVENALKGLDREPLDSAAIGDADRCTFGRWLAANADRIGPDRYAPMRALHATFHEEALCVAAMLRTRAAADVLEARRLRFDLASERLIGALFDARAELVRHANAR